MPAVMFGDRIRLTLFVPCQGPTHPRLVIQHMRFNMLDLAVLQDQIVRTTRARIVEWGPPEAGMDADLEMWVAGVIADLATDLMPALSSTQWIGALGANPEWLDHEAGFGDGTLGDAIKMTVRSILCERCNDAMDPDIEAYKAASLAAAAPAKGMSR